MSDETKAVVSAELIDRASRKSTLQDGTYAFLITGAARETLERGKLTGVKAARVFLTPVADPSDPFGSQIKRFSVPYSVLLPIRKEDGQDPPKWILNKCNRELAAIFGSDEIPVAPRYINNDKQAQAAREANVQTAAKVVELWEMRDATGGFVDDMGLANHLVYATVKTATAASGNSYCNVQGELMGDLPTGVTLSVPSADD